MKITQKTCFFLFSLTLSLVLFSCDAKDEDEEETTGTTTTTGSGGSTTNTATTGSATTVGSDIDTVAELNLSGALKITLPASIKAAGSSLGLVASGKSFEACELRRNIREGLRSLLGIANMFCHVEVESDNIVFGNKYNIITNDGEDPMQLWIDNSASDGSLTVYFCENGTLEQKFTISGASTDGVKGILYQTGTDTWEGLTQTYEEAATFDTGVTTSGRTLLTVKSLFTESTNSFKRQLLLDLNDSGISKVIVSNQGTWEGETFADAGAARFSSTYGQAIYKSKGTHEGQTFEWTHRSFFNAAGDNVESTVSSDFATGGDLNVTDSMVPKFLTDTFDPGGFVATDWDCSGGTDLVLDMTGAKGVSHQSCESDWDELEEENCWDSTYAQSDEEVVLDETEMKEGDSEEFEEFID